MGLLSALVRPRIGLALGGGAARGFAHLGVLRALESARCRPAAIAGTSIGAIIGGAYAAEGHSEPVRRRLVEYISSRRFRDVQLAFLSRRPPEKANFRDRVSRAVRRSLFFGRAYLRESYIPQEIYRDHLVGLVPDVAIEDLALPFAAVASDLVSGRAVAFRSGSLRRAVLASGAIPGVMPPMPLGEMILVDGVATDRVPVRVLLGMRVDVILAVDVATDFLDYVPPLRRGVAIHDRAHQVTEWNLRRIRMGIADVELHPAVSEFNPLDFPAALPAVARGEECVEQAAHAIRRALVRAGLLRWIGAARAQRARRLAARGWFGEPPVVPGPGTSAEVPAQEPAEA
ncbi:MAG: hypothetical protein Kow0062_01320 [Acidobacteriota bacterium]